MTHRIMSLSHVTEPYHTSLRGEASNSSFEAMRMKFLLKKKPWILCLFWRGKPYIVVLYGRKWAVGCFSASMSALSARYSLLHLSAISSISSSISILWCSIDGKRILCLFWRGQPYIVVKRDIEYRAFLYCRALYCGALLTESGEASSSSCVAMLMKFLLQKKPCILCLFWQGKPYIVVLYGRKAERLHPAHLCAMSHLEFKMTYWECRV